MARPSKDMMLITIFIVITAVLAVVMIYDLGAPDNDDVPLEYEASVDFLLEADNAVSLDCQIANTTLERQAGLMHISNLPEREGMLFILEGSRNATLWMKNVEIPLDMIFVDEDMRVVNIEEASVEPPDTPDSELIRYRSDSPVLYVIETNMGFCSTHGIEPGTEITITFS